MQSTGHASTASAFRWKHCPPPEYWRDGSTYGSMVYRRAPPDWRYEHQGRSPHADWHAAGVWRRWSDRLRSASNSPERFRSMTWPNSSNTARSRLIEVSGNVGIATTRQQQTFSFRVERPGSLPGLLQNFGVTSDQLGQVSYSVPTRPAGRCPVRRRGSVAAAPDRRCGRVYGAPPQRLWRGIQLRQSARSRIRCGSAADDLRGCRRRRRSQAWSSRRWWSS